MKTFTLASLVLNFTSLWALGQAQEPNPEPLPQPQTFDSLPYSFTFAAVNKTLPNSNSTGSPLVLGAGGRSTRSSFLFGLDRAMGRCHGRLDHLYHLGTRLPYTYSTVLFSHASKTWYSFPYNDYPSLGLVNRALRAFDKLGDWRTNVTIVRSGEKLVWSRSIMYPNPEDNSRVYSAIKNPSDDAVLGAYNISSLWSLCPDTRFRGQTQLVFNVSAVTPPPLYLPFDPYLCYDVKVNLVPV
jgi:hypothetical protein